MNELHKQVVYAVIGTGGIATWIIDFANAIHPVLADLALVAGIVASCISVRYMIKNKRPKT